MESSKTAFQVLLLGMVLFSGCRCQKFGPKFENDMNLFTIYENSDLVRVVYTLKAIDPDKPLSKKMSYFIDADMFKCEESTGEIKLTRPLDFEKEQDLSFKVTARDGDGQVTTHDVTVYVQDVNDNNPAFYNDTYSEKLKENSPINTVVIPVLNITDVDFSNDELTVYCDPAIAAQSKDPLVCSKFNLQKVGIGSNQNWLGRLRTSEVLDYEKASVYQIPLVAYDGKLRTNKSVEVTIIDIPDTPPFFTKANSVTVNEGIKPNKVVNDVIAKDGDVKNPRQIRYEIYDPSVPGLFTIDSKTGIIRTLVDLDRENLTEAFVTLNIKAREVISSGPEVLGDDPLTTAIATIRINILDVNDEVPTFDNSHYTITIFEDHKDGTGVGVTLTVTDRDQGSSGDYRLILQNEDQRFEVFPDRGQGTSFAGIRVINSSLIDYEAMGPNKRYILRVTTQETDPTNLPIPTATVTVNVLDVNDNTPTFSSPNYEDSVSETAPAGTTVINTINVQDLDTGNLGREGVRFRIIGAGSDRFSIDSISGIVTVSVCQTSTPGQHPCIDYEQKKQYDLTVIAEDELASRKGKQSTAGLRIIILDENDNRPIFSIGNYESYIVEGQQHPNPVIKFQVSDRDSSNNSIVFGIAKEDIKGLWTVDTSQRLISTKGVLYSETPNAKGKFIVFVTASDGVHAATATATINVLETNNNDPKFDQESYTEYIDENTAEGTSILKVSANDLDPPHTLAGQIDTYNIKLGAQGKFVINQTTGVISVAPKAKFDYDIQSLYTMVVSVSDKFQPRRTSDANVYIYIRDANNKDPYLVPLTHRADIQENQPADTFVIAITSKDPDTSSKIEYEFVEPIFAHNPNGVAVKRANYDYTTLFKIQRTTGTVRVNRKLDRDSASVVTLTVKVYDVAVKPHQTGSGTLIVNILEYNDQAPRFESPWNLSFPFYNVSVPEELPRGSWLMTLIAIDEDDTISEYRLTSPPGLFKIDPDTGVVSVRARMDFEKIESAQFTALAFDSGSPQLSVGTTVYVTILNENDNSPLFSQNVYEKEIRENSPGGTSIVTVKALDADKGDYGEVRYRVLDSRFLIDAITGRITVKDGAVLDRELEPLIAIQVEAYDSPLDPSKSRTNYIPVYISLIDENDNDPGFTLPDYKAIIIETIPPGRGVLQLVCADPDAGYNADVRYFRNTTNSNNPSRDFFKVVDHSGDITVGRSLLGHAGVYTFTVYCEDERAEGPTRRKATGRVTITVMRATNSPPLWVVPARENMTVFVLEEQYKGMMVYDVEAVDNDEEEDGRITYGFYNGNDFSSKTGEFEINPITGVIQAEIVYDRETVDNYRLLLVARDNGYPFLENTRFLTVRVRDVNDHLPRFPMQNGETIPYVFYATENAENLPVVIDKVTAIDDDLAKYADVFYYIVGGNEDGAFSIGIKTGEISMIKKIDREKQAEINLVVMATNNISDYTVIRNRKKRSADPNVVTVQIRIKDVNDEKPVFKQQQYYGCVNVDARYDQSIVRVEAEDKDALGSAVIVYRFIDGNDGKQFAIKSGVVSNKKLMQSYKGETFDLVVEAADSEDRNAALTATANVKVFVTQTNNEIKLVLAQPATEVRLFVNQIQRVLAEQFSDEIKYVCILEVKDHVINEVDSDSSQIWSDVYVAAADVNGKLFGTGELLAKMNEKRDRFGILHVKYIETAKTDKSLIDQTPVLAVLILVVILILLALLVLIVACYCIYKSKNHRLKKNEIERHHIVKSEVLDDSPVVVAAPAQEPIMIENTAYDNAVFIPEPEPEPEKIDLQPEPQPEPEPEPVYSVVDKSSRPASDVDPIPPEVETKQVEIVVSDSPLPSPPDSPRDSYRIETDVIEK